MNLCLADTQEATAVVYPGQEVGLVVDQGPEAIVARIHAADLVRSMIVVIDVRAITIGHDSLTIVSAITSTDRTAFQSEIVIFSI